jgi:hypothetical protein
MRSLRGCGRVGFVLVALALGCGDGRSPSGPTPPTFMVLGMAPIWGPEEGGTTLTITGRDLPPGATVTFGGTAATYVEVVSRTTILAIAPAHPAGPVVVAVHSADGETKLAGGFAYGPHPPEH